MSDQKSSYRQIMKATSLFGGVQVFNIIISIIRSKFVAIYLGTAGVGIMGLLQNSTSLIGSITSLGINSSAIRNISIAHESGDKARISEVITSFRRWIWFTGIVGLIATFALSPLLSKFSFGNQNYTIAFIWLSLTLLVSALSTGQTALLKGMRQNKYMAKASIYGAISGLFFSVPLFYFYGTNGIVPSMIISSFSSYIISSFFARKLNVKTAVQSIKESFSLGIDIVKLGVMMTLSGLAMTAVTYLVNAYISRTGSVSDVGLYQAGLAITGKYVGLVFTAMSIDYYPRLAAISQDNKKLAIAVNQQAEIAVLILAPILIILISTMPVVIKLLYTKEFLPVVGYVQWVVLGIIFKASSWCMGFILLAKGETRIYFYTELTANIAFLIFYITGYHYFGLEGLGIAFILGYVFYLILMLRVSKRRYDFAFSCQFIKIAVISFIGCLVAFLIAYFLGYPVTYYSGTIILLLISLFSWKELNKRMQLKEILLSKFSPNGKNK